MCTARCALIIFLLEDCVGVYIAVMPRRTRAAHVDDEIKSLSDDHLPVNGGDIHEAELVAELPAVVSSSIAQASNAKAHANGKGSNERMRNVCFTWNNYTEADFEKLKVWCVEKTAYAVIGKEVGKKEETPHLQGYFEMKNAMTHSALTKKVLPCFHESRKAQTAQPAIDYCKKDGDYWEHGKAHVNQGQRTDLQVVRDLLRGGGRMADVVDVVSSGQGLRAAEILLKYVEPRRSWETEVIWLFGSTGVGKSHMAHEMLPDAWQSNETLQWWDGYDAHEHVIIEEFRDDQCSFATLLRIFDKYPFRVQVKGGYRSLLAKKIVVTSCHHPGEMYSDLPEKDKRQLYRRIKECRMLYMTPEGGRDYKLLDIHTARGHLIGCMCDGCRTYITDH